MTFDEFIVLVKNHPEIKKVCIHDGLSISIKDIIKIMESDLARENKNKNFIIEDNGVCYRIKSYTIDNDILILNTTIKYKPIGVIYANRKN